MHGAVPQGHGDLYILGKSGGHATASGMRNFAFFTLLPHSDEPFIRTVPGDLQHACGGGMAPCTHGDVGKTSGGR